MYFQPKIGRKIIIFIRDRKKQCSYEREVEFVESKRTQLQ